MCIIQDLGSMRTSCHWALVLNLLNEIGGSLRLSYLFFLQEENTFLCNALFGVARRMMHIVENCLPTSFNVSFLVSVRSATVTAYLAF